tara:strand:+ start:895 stop:1554 length:660 start_codon:yes stop_codon:yes gene_type:complete
MKVGISVVYHCSQEFRPNGNELIEAFCDSAKSITYPFQIYAFDNESVIKTDKLNQSYVEVERVENQLLRGVTGPWNDGIKKAIDDSCDIIICSSDDVILNETFNKFIYQISTHEHNKVGLYGPLSNGILGGVQKQDGPIEQTLEVTNKYKINGFTFGFTRDFYNKFKMKNGNLLNEEKYPWGGQEEELQNRTWPNGARSFVLGSCWLFHHKIRGWKVHV